MIRRTAPTWLLLALAAAPAPADWADHPENRWVRQSPRDGAPAPLFGWEGSGGYDPDGRKWIHFGGHDGIPQGFHLFTYDLETGAWRQHFPNTSPPGVCCVDGANVFDPAHRRFVRFPGVSLGHGYQWSRGVKLKNSPVWLYDPASDTWANMRPPPYAAPLRPGDAPGTLNATATFDPVHELALSFGGQNAAGGSNGLFAYDAYANVLCRPPAANPPSPRDGNGLAYDAGNDCLVLFGSQYANDEKTWIYRYAAGRWEGHDLSPHPVGRKLGTYATIPRMAYDPANGVCLCVTWDTNTGRHETWAFDAGKLRWTKMSPAVEPDPSMSRSRNFSYSARHNVFILELTPKDKGKGVQIWTYRYGKPAVDKRPAPPKDLEIVTEPGKAVLTWKAGSPGVKEYRVYRDRVAEPWQAKFVPVGATAETTFTDKKLEAGQVYHYVVKAVAGDGTESPAGWRARTQPRVAGQPIVSVVTRDRVEVSWRPHPARDVVGYNLYRGVVTVRAVKKGTPGAWKDNDPEYAEPLPVEVRDVIAIRKLNDRPLTGTAFVDPVDLARKGPESGDYRFAVYAYILKVVNRLGTESGPSPYAMTIPSEPARVLCREQGATAELKWEANPEKAVIGYHVYRVRGTWNIVRVTDEPVRETTFRHQPGGSTRYWVVAVDALGQEGQPSSPAWFGQSYRGFYQGEWHP